MNSRPADNHLQAANRSTATNNIETGMMNHKATGIFLLTMAVMASADCQTVYKSIGPDGKPVYSDRPPDSAETKYDVMRGGAFNQSPAAPAASAASAPSTPPADAVETQPHRIRQAKKAIRANPPADTAPVEQPAAAKADLAVEKAVIGVLGMEDLVQRTETLCVGTLPTSYKRYSGAASGWKQRNGALVSQARNVLAQAFSAIDRQKIEFGIRAMNEKQLGPVIAAPMASKIKWCDNSSDEINSGVTDVHNRPNLSVPLMNYRPK